MTKVILSVQVVIALKEKNHTSRHTNVMPKTDERTIIRA